MATPTDAHWTALGPGSLTIKVGTAGTATEFSCEVLGASVTHDYDEGDTRRMLCGTVRGGGGSRTDGFKADLENDLTASGLYKFLLDHDLQQAEVTFTPNTVDAASWVLDVTLTLPDEIGADEFGNPIASSIEWTGLLKTFTPMAVAAPAGN